MDDSALGGGLGGKMRFRGFSIRNDDATLQITNVRYTLTNNWPGADGLAHATAESYAQMIGPVTATGIAVPLGPGVLGTHLQPAGVGNDIRPTDICIEVTWTDGATTTTEYYSASVHYGPTRLDFLVQIRLGLKPGQDATLIPESTSGISGAYRNDLMPPSTPNNDWQKYFDPRTITGSHGTGVCP